VIDVGTAWFRDLPLHRTRTDLRDATDAIAVGYPMTNQVFAAPEVVRRHFLMKASTKGVHGSLVRLVHGIPDNHCIAPMW
jgi:hypothetical protein